jgi:hypothetical protein
MNKKQRIRKIRFYLYRNIVGYFAPYFALVRMIKKRRWNYIHEMKVLYRFSYWKFYEPQNIVLTLDDYLDQYFPGLRAEIKADLKKRKLEFIKRMKPRTSRPNDLRAILIDLGGREFPIQWRADFEEKQLLIVTQYLSPMVLIELFVALPAADDRFAAAGIFRAAQINDHFITTICFEYKKLERWFISIVVAEEDGAIGVELTALEEAQ